MLVKINGNHVDIGDITYVTKIVSHQFYITFKIGLKSGDRFELCYTKHDYRDITIANKIAAIARENLIKRIQPKLEIPYLDKQETHD